MSFYQHEDYERKQRKTELNAVWPSMSASGKDMDAMRHYLEDRGLDFGLAEVNGWYPTREANDEYLRVVIPCVNPVQGHVYWQARAIATHVYIRYQSPKCSRLDSLVHVCPIEDGEKGTSEKVVVVEGPMDALAAAFFGYESIALMGITPPLSTLDFLSRLCGKRPTLVALDNEDEAQGKGIDIAMVLAAKGMRVRHVAPPGKDLADLSVARRKAFLTQAMTKLGGTR